MSDPLSCPSFTATEQQAAILELAAHGYSDKQIARRLGIAYRTVRTQLERLYLTSGVRGRVAVVVAWLLSAQRAQRLAEPST